MSDDLEFIVIDDIPEYIFCIGDDEENERVIALSGKDGAFKYEKVAELPTTGEDGVLYLVPKSHTTQTASGNPINVNITDNAGKIESLKLDGDTEQQTYTGKNLIGSKLATIKSLNTSGVWSGNSYTKSGITWTLYENDDGTIDRIEVNGTSTVSGNTFSIMNMTASEFEGKFDPSQTYTLSGCPSGGSTSTYYVRIVSSPWKALATDTGSGRVGTFDLPTGYTRVYVVLCVDPDAGQVNNLVFRPMLEKGSSVTSYEPYVGGGAPSPNPDYPQTVQTVTGAQTVSINGTDYPIDLGSLELCKLSTYQDYIYKDGDDWKVHKATKKVALDGSEEWRYYNTVCQLYSITDYAISNNIPYCGAFKGVSNVAGLPNVADNTCCFTNVSGQTTPRFYVRYSDKFTSADSISSYLTNNPTSLYYPLATPTDTTITDTALIAQLEAVRTAALSTGSNTISNTATGTNLAGDLEIGYYGYDPLNKYDKYFWLDVDGEYESL